MSDKTGDATEEARDIESIRTAVIISMSSTGEHPGYTHDHYDEAMAALNRVAARLRVVLKEHDEKNPAYIEHYEGVSEHDYIPGCFAMCGECDWQGPHRDTDAEAQVDVDEHNCLAMVKAALLRAEEALRKEWWMNHGHPYPALYGDDGEMQCAMCPADFKRDPIDRLEKKVFEARLARASAHASEKK